MPLAAICTDIPEFHQGRILEASYAQRFPGAAVFPAFADAMRSRGWVVATGDQLLNPQHNRMMDIKDTFVIQEEDSAVGKELITQGATPALILSGESPLYARDFYRNISQVCYRFPHRILFTGAHEAAGQDGSNHPLLFPTFHRDETLLETPWEGRRHLVLVAGNKYWRHADSPWPLRLRRFWSEARNHQYISWLRQHQLHDRRLEVISHFTSVGKLDVYGAGWDRLGHLPRKHQESLTYLGPPNHLVQDKLRLLAGYRFTLTMENFAYPGYVTEKIFDALVAGSIPIYLGAPDIESFVPVEAFIDMRKFSSIADLEAFLDNLDQATAKSMIAAGQRFLQSEVGQRHSFESRGQFFAELVTEVAAQ